jgi:hypothetical protein
MLYSHGSSAYTQWFEDFEGNVAAALGQAVQLDEYGAAAVYVNELTRVVVSDASGTTVRNYVDASAAAGVETRSLSFTGADYESGQQLPGNPTTLQALLDRWKEVNGAIDWKVPYKGTATPISDAIAALSGAGCNVKNPAYAGGATGDGVEDDTDAIEAAILDCVSLGGGYVFFPPGDYRYTDTISVPFNVGLQGSGPELTKLSIDNASNAIGIELPGSTSADGPQLVTGIAFLSKQANTSELVSYTDGRPWFQDCLFGEGTHSTGDLVKSAVDGSITSYILRAEACEFVIGDRFAAAISNRAAATKVEAWISGCTTRTPSDFTSQIFEVSPATVTECVFDLSNLVGGCWTAYLADGGSYVDNRILGDGNNVLGVVTPLPGSSALLVESGSNHGPLGNIADTGASGTDAAQLQSLRTSWQEVIDNAATFFTSASLYGVELLHRTASGAQNVNLVRGVEGHKYTLVLWNDGTGGNITFTWAGSYAVTENASETVGNNERMVVEFVCIGSNREMVQSGSAVIVT